MERKVSVWQKDTTRVSSFRVARAIVEHPRPQAKEAKSKGRWGHGGTRKKLGKTLHWLLIHVVG